MNIYDIDRYSAKIQKRSSLRSANSVLMDDLTTAITAVATAMSLND